MALWLPPLVRNKCLYLGGKLADRYGVVVSGVLQWVVVLLFGCEEVSRTNRLYVRFFGIGGRLCVLVLPVVVLFIGLGVVNVFLLGWWYKKIASPLCQAGHQ